MPLISIIIPCYNGYQYMSNCLAALERQTVRDFEVLVVDDCSTDDSYAKLMAYKARSKLDITVIQNTGNMGPGPSRNRAMRAAKGDWLAFCDADDWYEDDFLECMLDRAEASGAPLVMCDHNYAYGDGNKKKCGVMDVFSQNPDIDEIIAHARMSLCRLLVKRTLFEGIELPPLFHGEDAAVVPQLISKAGKVGIEKKALYNYLIRENSASITASKTVAYEFISAYQVVKDAIHEAHREACEFVGINTVCYSASLSLLKAGAATREIHEIMCEFNNQHKDWIKNRYFAGQRLQKKIYLLMLAKKCYFYCRVYAVLHTFALTVLSRAKK